MRVTDSFKVSHQLAADKTVIHILYIIFHSFCKSYEVIRPTYIGISYRVAMYRKMILRNEHIKIKKAHVTQPYTYCK